MTGGIRPTLPELEQLAATARYAPLYREVLADTETPVSALLKLGAGPGSFLLESAEGGEFVARYSFVAAGLDRSLVLHEDVALQYEPGGVSRLYYDDPLVLIDRLVARPDVARLPDLPRFAGGAVGYLGYELARKFEPRIPAAPNDPLGLPLGHLMMVDTLLVFDHLRRTIKVVTYVPLEGDLAAEYQRGRDRIDGLLDRLRAGSQQVGLEDAPSVDHAQRPAAAQDWAGAGGHRGSFSPAPPDAQTPSQDRGAGGHSPPEEKSFPPPLGGGQGVGIQSNLSRTEFEDLVREAKESIAAGECIQIVLSQRLSVPTTAQPVSLYRALRSINPSPYMYFLNFGDYQIVGSSPELLVLVEDGNVSTRPIAGTRPRGASPAEDDLLAAQLLEDPKERAEHVMLVDLGRNDVGRIAVPGTVAVPRLMEVERYSHVMHIVSHVTGRLRPECRPVDALRSCFPAGTLSGAPKIRAMELIATLEQDQRGPYGGAIGFFNVDGDLETAITIRTMVLKDGVAHIQVGAGIVADSDPALEWEESMNKARAVLAAVAEAERIEAGHEVPEQPRRKSQTASRGLEGEAPPRRRTSPSPGRGQGGRVQTP